jgi:NTP pyrophosphatase (non-canonical NTP hydrolase)
LKANEYQQLACVTKNKKLNTPDSIANYSMGIAGESGELVDYIKKYLYHGHDFDLDHVRKELGDVLWYVAVLADTVGIPLDQVMEHNINKLRARFPEGFSEAASRNRTI